MKEDTYRIRLTVTEFYSDCIVGTIIYEKEMPTELFVPQYNLSRILVRKVATATTSQSEQKSAVIYFCSRIRNTTRRILNVKTAYFY